MGGISIWQVLIVLIIVILLFGTSKLKNVGADLGSALKGFKKAIKDEDKEENKADEENQDADFESLKKPQNKESTEVPNDATVNKNETDKQKTKD